MGIFRKPRLLVSFSGGKTSGYMAHLLKREWSDVFDLLFVFANTGQEREETYEFVRRCDEYFDLDLVWVEAEVFHGSRKGCGHRVVDFNSADRTGQVFEEMIKKYGIPNQAWPHCTRELKANPIRSYAKSIGWNVYFTAIGIRTDEAQRGSPDDAFVYPLISHFPTDKIDVNTFWESMPFTLELEEHQGNCAWCWKKSAKKLHKLIDESPEIFDFPDRMEKLYGLAGHNTDGTSRVFFRGNKSTEMLFAEHSLMASSEARDDPDLFSGCSESCEPFLNQSKGV